MAKDIEPLEKKDCANSFYLRGALVLGTNPFKIDEHSDKGFIYNSTNIGLNCGPKYGTIYTQAMGGYNTDSDNTIAVFGTDANGKTDFSNRFDVEWDDRFDENVLSSVGDISKFVAIIEKDTKGKYVKKEFLSKYDLVEYLSNVLVEGEEYSIAGDVRYREYNGKVYQDRHIRRITKVEYDEEKRSASFNQTIFAGPGSVVDKNKEKGIITAQAYVFEKGVKIFRGHDLTEGGSVKTKDLPVVPFAIEFDIPVIDPSDGHDRSKMIQKFFMHKKGYNKITAMFFFSSGGEVVSATIDDLNDDIKEMIEIGAISLEDALADCAGNNGGGAVKYIFDRIRIGKVIEKDKTLTVPKVTLGFYKDEEIDDQPYMTPADEDEDGFMKVEDDPEIEAMFDTEEEKKPAKAAKPSKEEKAVSPDDSDDFNLDDLFDNM